MKTADPRPPARRRTWTAGTLRYTAGGLTLLFVWLLFGDFGYMMRERSAAPVAQLMLKQFHASDLVTGLFLLTIPWAVILLLGPAVSYWSDRHRGRWGRRIPFLLGPTPFVVLAMVGLAYSPRLGAALNRRLGWPASGSDHTVVLVMGLFWTVFEIGVVISNSVFNGLINDVVPRELLGRFYGLFRAVGLAVGVLFNYKIIGHAEQHARAILLGIGLIYGVGFILMCLCVKEGEYPPPPEHRGGFHPVFNGLADYARDCFARPYYLLVFLFLGLATLAFVPVNLFSIYAAKAYGMSMASYGRYLVVTYICSFVLAFPLGWLADRWHPLRVGIGAMIVYAGVMFLGYWGMHDAPSFGWVFLVHGVLAGTYYTGAAALPQLLFPKVKFAQFAAAAGLIAAVFNMVLGPVLGAVMDGLGRDYRYTFLASGVIGLLAALSGGVLYRRWRALGGDAHYVAPE